MRRRPFYIIHMENQGGFPDLDAYTHNEALARAYAHQWEDAQPKIYLFYADNIIELTNDTPEYKKIDGLGCMTDDCKLEVHYYQLNGFHTEEDHRTEFITTSQQCMDVTEGGYDGISETIQYLVCAVCNMMIIAKYIKEPMFAPIIKMIYCRYLALIILSDGLGDFDLLDMDRVLKLDPRIETGDLPNPDNCQLCIDNYMDLEYLLYLIIKANA